MTNKYWIECTDKNTEYFIKYYLLKHADTISFIYNPWREVSYFIIIRKKGTKNDKKFIDTLEKLRKNFIKKENKNKHSIYYYKFSDNIKQMFNTKKLFNQLTPEFSKNFYGFEDPTFYKNNKIIGGVISHENYFYVYLDNKQKENFEKKKIHLRTD